MEAYPDYEGRRGAEGRMRDALVEARSFSLDSTAQRVRTRIKSEVVWGGEIVDPRSCFQTVVVVLDR